MGASHRPRTASTASASGRCGEARMRRWWPYSRPPVTSWTISASCGRRLRPAAAGDRSDPLPSAISPTCSSPVSSVSNLRALAILPSDLGRFVCSCTFVDTHLLEHVLGRELAGGCAPLQLAAGSAILPCPRAQAHLFPAPAT
jgi:hypothetical protein